MLQHQISVLALCQCHSLEDLPLEDNGEAHRLSVGINCSFLCHSKSQVNMVDRTGGATKLSCSNTMARSYKQKRYKVCW